MAKTYTVKWGDTLSQIAADNNTTYQTLAKINNIPDPNYIVVGQVIKLTDDEITTAKVTSGKVKIQQFGLRSGSQTEVFVTWSWDRSNTKEYNIQWEEYVDGHWELHEETTQYKYDSFTASDQASKVRVRIKPVSKTYTNSSNKEVSYWTNVSWTTKQTYSFSSNPPLQPSSAPTVSINDDKILITLDASGLKASIIEFDIAKNDSPSYKKKKVSVTGTNTASVELTIDIGGRYKVRARSIKSDQSSAWSSWSGEYSTVPAAPELKKCMEGSDEASIDVEWSAVTWATNETTKKYKIEFCGMITFPSSDADYPIYSREFDDTTTEFTNCYAKLNGDDVKGLTGKNIYIRIQAINSVGESAWSEIGQTNIGNGPAAPQTSSNRTFINVGKTVTLQWVHSPANNTTNNSSSSTSSTENYAKYSHIDLYVNGIKRLLPTIIHDGTNGEVEKTHKKFYTLNTKAESSEDDDFADIVCKEGATLSWRARTAGEDGVLGEWSVVRTIEVYAQPVLSLKNNVNDEEIESESTINLYEFPLKIKGSIDPIAQYIIGYHTEIVANQTHETLDNYGETTVVQEGDVVYSKSFDNISGGLDFVINLTAGDIRLTTDINYTLTCTVTMNSGLSVAKSFNFNVLWASSDYYLDADIEIDTTDFTATIQPFCKTTSDGELVENMLLYVYRREYDGSFTRISGDIDNMGSVHVVDPHPALDYARYRIVATSKDGSTNIYTDLLDYPVGGKSIILQWDEKYNDFSIDDDSDYAETKYWGGQMLKLPYNIDVSNKYSPDVSLVEYIGRNFPVSYYGTQLGESATWNATIPKSDKETLYALRRLARWMGDVYVREPSGSGYWANIEVSFPQKHLDLVIPVTINIVRVEGGK